LVGRMGNARYSQMGITNPEVVSAMVSTPPEAMLWLTVNKDQPWVDHKAFNFSEPQWAGRTMEAKFGRGNGRHIGTSSEIEARIERKRAMGPAPRMAGLRTEPAPSGPRPKTGSEIVREMRRARGYATE
jgi:hypothetical protein